MSALAFIGVALSAFIGVPLFVVMAMMALVAFTLSDIETSSIAIEIYKVSSSSSLMTIPLFTLAGYIMAESNAPKRLVRFAESVMGWLPGGVAIVGICVCAFFTAFTGASGVTIIAIGGLLFPILQREGFSEKFSLGLITSSGSLGLLFAPSLPLILYGVVAGVNINDLFKAGLIPGAILILVISLWAIRSGRGLEFATQKFEVHEFVESFKACFFELLLPVGVLFGIYGGVVTPSEAASLTAFYILIVECFIYKDIKLENLPRIILDSMCLVGTILLILCCALGVTNYLVDEEIPTALFNFIRQFITNKYAFLAFLNIFLLIVGSFMDIFSAIIVVVPLIIPIATDFGIHPVHLAIIFLTNLEIGYLTPPIGLNLFISSVRFKKSIIELYKASFPFLILMILSLIIITYIPQISLILIK